MTRTFFLISLLLLLASPSVLLAERPGDDPEVLPFRLLSVKGTVEENLLSNSGSNLSFDAEFLLNEKSDSIQLGDDVTIRTFLAYPIMTNQLNRESFFAPLVRMVLSIHVQGECFDSDDSGSFYFEMSSQNRQPCVRATLLLSRMTQQGKSEDPDSEKRALVLTFLLRAMRVELIPPPLSDDVQSPASWRLRSYADFAGPNYPFPVAGFGHVKGMGRAGTSIRIGDDGGTAPFRGVQFQAGYGPVDQ